MKANGLMIKLKVKALISLRTKKDIKVDGLTINPQEEEGTSMKMEMNMME